MSGRRPSDDDFDRLRARMDESLSAIRGALSEYRQGQRMNEARAAEIEEERQKRARSGELGPEWQRVQQRIDLNQTTLEDIFEGRDESPEARALTERARETIVRMARAREDAAGGEAGEPSPIDEVERMRAEFEARAARFARPNLGGNER